MSQTATSTPSVLDIPKFAAESQMPDANPDLNPAMPEDEGDFESVADRLMDNLFADVERMLDRGVDLLPEPSHFVLPTPLPQPEGVTDAPIDLQSLTLLPKLSPRPSLLDQAETEEELSDLAALMAEVTEEEVPPKRSFDKLLLSLIGVALVAVGGAWFYFRNRTPAVVAVPPSATQLQQQQNQEFLDYVSRSLDRLERDAKAQRQADTIAAAAPSPSPSASPSTVLERVYIPIYQSPVAASSALPAFPQTASQIAPQTTPPNTSQIAPQNTPPNAPQPASQPTAAPNIAAAATHVLIGVLELGDRSAALFEISGTPQRIQIGESIGGSGWTLVSIKNQEAIVRRNGEVRSIYVGQQF